MLRGAHLGGGEGSLPDTTFLIKHPGLQYKQMYLELAKLRLARNMTDLLLYTEITKFFKI